MSQQIMVPNLDKGNEYMKVSDDGECFIDLLSDFLSDGSNLKKNVNHEPTTAITATNTILGAALTSGSMEEIAPIFELFTGIVIKQLQSLAIKHGWDDEEYNKLSEICIKFQSLHPFAHRTTVQGMLNGHKKENSDVWLGKSFQENIEKLDAVGYKPKEGSVNLDPHFADFNPKYKNGEIRKVLIGGKTTLKTGFQFNLTNITPIGLFNAFGLAPKRQKNKEDLGDLRYAIVFGKAFERLEVANIQPANGQADRGLNCAGLFSISQKRAWPSASGEIGPLSPFLDSTFLFTPWKSTGKTKAQLILDKEFSDVMVSTTLISKKQYVGGQELVKYALGDVKNANVPIKTVIITIRCHKGKQMHYNPAQIQNEVKINCEKVKAGENQVEILKNKYLSMPSANNSELTPKGLQRKLNRKKKERQNNETHEAWMIRKEYRRAKVAVKRLRGERDAFLREFQVFEIGVGEPFLSILEGTHDRTRHHLVAHLKKLCSQYGSRWCIESGFEMMKCHFPLKYKGRSSDTHVRIFILQCLIYNDFRVAQIKQIGATKPYNWKPWEPKNKNRCRRLSAKEQRMYSTRTYLLDRLGISLNAYFCRALN